MGAGLVVLLALQVDARGPERDGALPACWLKSHLLESMGLGLLGELSFTIYLFHAYVQKGRGHTTGRTTMTKSD